MPASPVAFFTLYIQLDHMIIMLRSHDYKKDHMTTRLQTVHTYILSRLHELKVATFPAKNDINMK